jgi:acyl carrier protein
MSDSLNLLVDAVCRVKGILPASVTATMPIEDLLMDSLDEVEVMMFLEDELGIEIDQAQIESCVTVGDFAAVVDRLVARKANG